MSPIVLQFSRSPPGPKLFPYTTLFRSPMVDLPAPGGPTKTTRGRVTAVGCGGILGRVMFNFPGKKPNAVRRRSEEHTSELQSRGHLVCRLLLEKKNGTARAHAAQRGRR